MDIKIENNRLIFFSPPANENLDLEIIRHYTIDNIYFQIDTIDGNVFCFDINTTINNNLFSSIQELILYLDELNPN